MANPSLSVVIVSYNSSATIEACLASVPAGADTVVVDQAPADDALTEIMTRFPGVRRIRAGTNRGFGAGCNLGAAQTTGDVLIFLNPDATLADGAAQLLAASVTRSPGLVGPTIHDSDGHVVTRARHWSRVTTDLAELLVPARLVPKRLRRDLSPDDPAYRRRTPVPYVQGACFALLRLHFDAVGGFDEHFFLYSEEEVLSAKLLAHGITTRVEPDAAVVHVGGTSTAHVQLFSTEQYFRSRVLLYRLQKGRTGGTLAAAVLAMALGFLTLTSPVRSVIGYRKAFPLRACLAALAGLRSGVLRQVVSPPASQPVPALDGSPRRRD